MTARLHREVNVGGNVAGDVCVWRFDPGHPAAARVVGSSHNRRLEDYQRRLPHFLTLARVTGEGRSP